MKNTALVLLMLLFSTSSYSGDCSTEKPELFNNYLSRFSTDGVFSSTRTIFPLRVLVWEYGLDENGKDDSGPAETLISIAEYKKWPTLKDMMVKNGLSNKIKSQTKDDVVLELYKEGTDWQIDYYFKNKNGCWYFWKYENASL
jgi:hypothetical protein